MQLSDGYDAIEMHSRAALTISRVLYLRAYRRFSWQLRSREGIGKTLVGRADKV